MKRKIIAAVLSMTMAISMTACGSAQQTKDLGKAETETKVQEEAEEENTASGSEKAEIAVGEGEVVTIWECNWGGDAYEAALQKLAGEATNANIDGKGYKIEVTMVPWDNYNETFMTAAVAGTAPDIAAEASTSPYQYAQMGETLDLSPIYDAWVEEGNPIVEEIPQSVWDFEKYNGQLIAIPFAIDGVGIVYNKDLFANAGVEVPESWDWNGFEEACAKLKESGVTALVFTGNNLPGLSSIGDAFCISNGTGVIDTDYNPTILSDANQETYAYIKELYDNGYIAEGVMGYDSTDAQRLFLNGDAAMYFGNGFSFVPEADRDKYVALTPFKGPSADELLTSASYQAYYAYDQSGHPDATRAVLKWWIENNDILWTEGNHGTIPIQQSKLERVIDNELVKDFAATWCIEHGKPSIYPLTSFAPFSSTLDSMAVSSSVLEAIFTDGDIQEASEKTTREIQEVIASYEE